MVFQHGGVGLRGHVDKELLREQRRQLIHVTARGDGEKRCERAATKVVDDVTARRWGRSVSDRDWGGLDLSTLLHEGGDKVLGRDGKIYVTASEGPVGTFCVDGEKV